MQRAVTGTIAPAITEQLSKAYVHVVALMVLIPPK